MAVATPDKVCACVEAGDGWEQGGLEGCAGVVSAKQQQDPCAAQGLRAAHWLPPTCGPCARRKTQHDKKTPNKRVLPFQSPPH